MIGSALVRREPFVEPNLVQLLPATVTASSEFIGNVKESLTDDSEGSNWYSNGNAGDFIEVTFPIDTSVTQLRALNPSGRPDGFGTSLGISCSGSFTFLDANRSVLFDSGVVNEPSGSLHPSDFFTLDVPNLTGVRHIRYTVSSCTGNFPAGFAEWRVIGSADVTTPAFGLGEKFQSLQGREAHSTPIVVNLTDDNGDGVIDADDIPDIVVPVEAIGDQLRGEIKAISGDDGRELFTAGGPNLVSPWSELAAADIDGDGMPEIIAVHSDGSHLIAFEHTGVQKWISDANAMPSFNIGAIVYTGAISIANLDGAGAPEIIVGASVFDADGHLLGDGRTLGGTTGGVGLRSAISAVGDIDLDRQPELVAGPTAYRLTGGQLTTVWQRTDRADGYVGIANLDDDPQAEIVSVANGVVYVLNHDGSDEQGWNAPTHAPVAIPGGGQGGAPLIVDVDGDGRPEIGVAAASHFVLFNRDGSVRWMSAISDRTSNSTGAVAFDLNGDGEVEIIYRDEFFLRIYRGADGVLLAKTVVGSATWAEEPVVADVDNDGHADIVVSSDFFRQSLDDTGIIVFQDVANKWKRTRRIWNQHSYHVTNVNEDATIPLTESAHWLIPGLNAFRTNAFVPGESAEETDSFTYVASDGVLDSNAATVRIAIRTPNSAPLMTSTPTTSAADGVVYSYAAQAVDPDAGDILTFSLPTAPAGMSIDPQSGLVQWAPTLAQQGLHSVIVKVADVRGLFAVQGYQITVGAPLSVPDIVGQLQTAAENAIGAASLAVGDVTSRYSAGTSQEAVISQNPVAGAPAAAGSPVSFVLSLGPPPVGTVPNVVGLTQTSAQQDIGAAGYTSAISGQNNSTIAAGIVISQNPVGGTVVPTTTPVNLVVSLGPPPGELDLDLDGFTGNQGDCNDSNPAINPGAFDIPGDGIDQNCNGVDSIAGDSTLPTASIVTPDDLATITMPTDIVGTATDANFLRYTLTMSEVDASTVETIGSGTFAVANGIIGRLDPTLLENGLYRVRLIAEDINGATSIDERVYRIDGQAKVGNFRLSFVDLSVPVVGIPITLVRTYDSRVKTRETFGVGWTLAVTRGSYRHNRTPGRGWIIRDQPVLGDVLPCIGGSQETLSHLTDIRLSERESYRFGLTVANGNLGITGACEGTASFRLVGGTRPGATLEILDGTGVIYLRGGDDTLLDLNAFLDGTSRAFDPQRVRLTTADGTIVELTRRDGITRIEDRNGNAITITASGIVHSSGKSISFVRDGQDRIAGITDPVGNQLAYLYDGNGDLVAFTDAAGQPTTYVYDARHNLLDLIDPLGRRLIRNEYDADGRMIAVTDAAGSRSEITHEIDQRRETITNRLGQTTLIDYDERGNFVRVVDALGGVTEHTYDALDNVLTETDPLGHTRSFTYDASSNRLSSTDPLGNTTSYTYNARNQELTRTDARGGVWSRGYDSRGNLTVEIDPLGNLTRHTYSARGNELSQIDTLGGVRRYQYDGAGRMIEAIDQLGVATQFGFDANGNNLTRTTYLADGTAATWRHTFDALNRSTATIDPEGGVRRTTYGNSGLVDHTIDPLGRVTRFVYDAQGRQTATEFADGLAETTQYDAEGRQTGTTDRGGRVTTFTLDALGRQISTTFDDGTSRQRSYDAAGRIESERDELGRENVFITDAAGRRTSLVDAIGGRTVFAYDAVGSVTSQTTSDGRTTDFIYDLAGRAVRSVFADGTSTHRTYDALGRLVAVTDQGGKITRYEYNARNELTAVIDAAGNTTQYSYDALGNRVTQTDALGRVTRFSYDKAQRPLIETLPLGQTTTRTYDAGGNVATVRDANGATTTFGYNAVNQLIAQALPGGVTQNFTYTPTGLLATMSDARGTTSVDYDRRDRPVRVREPGGTEVRYAYDAKGNRLRTIAPDGTTEYAYDAADRLSTIEDADGNDTAFVYDVQGRRTQTTHANGVVTDYEYDTLGRLTFMRHGRNGTLLRSYAYTLSPEGNRLQVVEDTGRRVNYSYDTLLRLTREEITPATGAPFAISYTYDAAGNRLTKLDNAGSLAYSYDANDRLISAGGRQFGYDANGNVTSEVAGATSSSYLYDGLNRLREATNPGAGLTRYAYDGLGNRTQTVNTAGGTVDSLIDRFAPAGLAQVMQETDQNGATIARYVHDGASPISQSRGGSTSVFLTDGQGSVRLITDAAGNITDSFDYDAFGELLVRNGSTTNSYLYNGQQLDPGTGWYYLRARYYDPHAGRFHAIDPAAASVLQPSTLHSYAYARNDPVNFADPSGENWSLSSVSVAFGAATVLSGVAYGFHTGDVTGGLGIVAVGVGIAVGGGAGFFAGWTGRSVLLARAAAPVAPLAAAAARSAPSAPRSARLVEVTQVVPRASRLQGIAESGKAVLPELPAANRMTTAVVELRVVRGTDFYINNSGRLTDQFRQIQNSYMQSPNLTTLTRLLNNVANTTNGELVVCGLSVVGVGLSHIGPTAGDELFDSLFASAVENVLLTRGVRCVR